MNHRLASAFKLIVTLSTVFIVVTMGYYEFRRIEVSET